MNTSIIKKFPWTPLLLPGMIFLGINLWTSYDFYQVNSYKVLLALLGVTLLAIRNAPFWPNTYESKIPWRNWAILVLPLVATVPGLFLHRADFNYNLRYELATNLTLFLWVTYLIRGTQEENDLHPFLVFIGITVIYAGTWSAFEKAGLIPWVTHNEAFIKSTFGHRNYFSGFLILLVPLFLVFSIPDLIFTQPSLKKMQLNFTKSNLFYCAALIFGGFSLLLAQTRAAIAACLIAFMLVIYLYSQLFSQGVWKKRIKVLLILIVGLAILAGIILYIFSDQLQGSRFAALFTMKAWKGRLLPWQTAITSVQDSPLFGFGLGSSYNLFFTYVDPAARLFHPEHSYNHAHSEILEYIQESGIFGLVLFFCFWGYILRQLIKTLRDPESTPFLKKLAIGVTGGFLAYHIHSTFSVAPRMIVMKLPLFTLIAFVFLMIKLKKSPLEKQLPLPILKKAAFGLPTLLILGLIWLIFLPWVAGQHQFVSLQRQRPSLLMVEKLEKLVKITPDIYALDHLSRLQLRYQRTNELAETVKLINSIIPYYREVGYTETVLAVINRDLKKAKQIGLKAQQRDRYYVPTIFLLMEVGLKSNDFDLFFSQFQLLARKQVFRYGLLNSRNETDVQISLSKMKEPIEVVETQERLEIKWNEKLIQQMYDIGRSSRTNKTFSNRERDQYWAFLMHVISKDPYFKIDVYEPNRQQDAQLIQNTIRSYFLAKRELEINQRQIKASHQSQIKSARPIDRPELIKQQSQKLDQIYKAYRMQIEPLERLLKEKTDWETFLKKQQFTTEFAKQLVSILFPGSRK